MPEPLTCDTCKFFLAQQPGQPRECHRFPPAVQLHIDMILHPESGQPEMRVTKYVAYPAPQPDWLACGEYRVGIIEARASDLHGLIGHPRPSPRPRNGN
jgi:hypothetical protein